MPPPPPQSGHHRWPSSAGFDNDRTHTKLSAGTAPASCLAGLIHRKCLPARLSKPHWILSAVSTIVSLLFPPVATDLTNPTPLAYQDVVFSLLAPSCMVFP